MAAQPIGIFDSGAGGLSILAGVHQLLPSEQLLYLADSVNAPYGPKGDAFIRERCEHIMQFFLQQQAKAIVVACNTATAAAISSLREQYDLPIIGVEPAVKPAATASKSGVVGVLATSGTIASDKFLSLQNRFNDQVEIITCPCPGLVEAIEKSPTDNRQLTILLNEFISPLLERGIDTLVLGCTHYSLVREQISQCAGATVSIVDAGDAVARELQRRLQELHLLDASASNGSVRFFSNAELSEQQMLLQRFWGQAIQLSAW